MAIEVEDRRILIPLFAGCRYDTVVINSVLEGRFGRAYADSADEPAVARLDSGAFTVLGGDPGAAATMDLLHLAPIRYTTPQNYDWRNLLQDRFGARISVRLFTEMSPASLDPVQLGELASALPPVYELRRIDEPLARRLPSDVGNPYFLEHFQSVQDFLARGIGYCLLHQNRVVSAATSAARSTKAIDIEIETVPSFRRQGLGTAVGARLALHCLERGIEPQWLAANTASERLALKLGYVLGEAYETFAIW